MKKKKKNKISLISLLLEWHALNGALWTPEVGPSLSCSKSSITPQMLIVPNCSLSLRFLSLSLLWVAGNNSSSNATSSQCHPTLFFILLVTKQQAAGLTCSTKPFCGIQPCLCITQPVLCPL